MSAMSAQPSKRPSPCCKEAQRVKEEIDILISQMHQKPKFTPTRNQLEEMAEELIDLINKHHTAVKGHESHLKAAIIDLTEVPEMTPVMQRVAFLTALKDASKEVQRFLNCF